MADRATLKKFHVEEDGEGFSLRIEDESGGILELTASREQLDVIADSLDDLLSATEAADEVSSADDED